MTLRGLPPRLRWYIVVVATAGLLASVAVVLLEPGVWDRSVWPRLAVLLVLTAASEIAGLRLPHRGALEMLNLYEGMVVVNIALLPAGQAIAVSLGGLLVAQVVQRRAPVKAVFNLGMYATALAPAIGRSATGSSTCTRSARPSPPRWHDQPAWHEGDGAAGPARRGCRRGVSAVAVRPRIPAR